MDRMVPGPRTFKELVEADLRRAARLIIKVQDEVDPQFRIATSEGDFHLAVTLPRDPRERMMMLRRVSAFMAWKKALGFVPASELHVPDCVYALAMERVGVARDKLAFALCRVLSAAEEKYARSYLRSFGYAVLDGSIPEHLGYREAMRAGRSITETDQEVLDGPAKTLMLDVLHSAERNVDKKKSRRRRSGRT